MKKSTAGALSGCMVWLILIGIIASCLLPVSIVVGSITSSSQYAIRITGNLLCPDGTTPESHLYQTITTDEYGNRQPSTAYELRCVNRNGDVVKEDPIVYAFLWIGVLALLDLVTAGILAFILAASAGILIGRLLDRRQIPAFAANLEPE